MEEEYKKEKSPSDSPAEPKIYDPFFEDENNVTEKPNKPIYEEGIRLQEENPPSSYDAKDPKGERRDDGNNDKEGRADPRKNLNNEPYSREGQKNKNYGQHLNPQGESNPYKATYPELHQRMEKESEILIHFYVKNVSSYYPKNEAYKKLYDILQQYGPVKEISLQRVNNDVYDFAIGMKYDDAARYIVENEKILPFIHSMERNDGNPYLETSFIFNCYLKNLSSERNHYDIKKEGKYSVSSHESQRRGSSYDEERRSERDYDRNYDRNKESANKDRSYQYKASVQSYKKNNVIDISRSRSRSRSRSKSPSGRHFTDDRKRDFESDKIYQVKDFLNKRKVEVIEIPDIDNVVPIAEKTDIKVNVEVNPTTAGQIFQYSSGRLGQPANEKPLIPGQRPEKPPGPPAGQPGGNEYNAATTFKESVGKSLNPVSAPFYAKPPNFPDPKTQPGTSIGSSKEPGKGGIQQLVPIGQVAGVGPGEPVIEYDNYCLMLGIPTELTEHQIVAALKAQNIEQPIKCEWVEEGVTSYLRMAFKSDKTVKELILKEITVGPTLEDLIYPVLILPWLKDKKIEDLLVYHQVQVESSIPLDSLFLHLFYSPYGPLADIIDMKPSKHVLIFTKQPHAQHVMSIPQISLQKNNIEVIMKHSVVDSCYPLVRKNLQAHQQTIMTQYIKSVKPTSLANAAVEEAVQQEQRQPHESPPHFAHKEGFSSGKKYEKKVGGRYQGNDGSNYSPNMRYEDEGYFMEKERGGGGGGNRSQFPPQNYRMDKYRHNDRMPERNEFYEGNRRRDNPRNQPYAPRYNQGGDQGGFGGPSPGNRPYNYQYGRNQEQRQHQYHQNASPDSRPHYHQGRNTDMRPQDRGLDYRGTQGKGHEQRQQPPYPK